MRGRVVVKVGVKIDPACRKVIDSFHCGKESELLIGARTRNIGRSGDKSFDIASKGGSDAWTSDIDRGHLGLVVTGSRARFLENDSTRDEFFSIRVLDATKSNELTESKTFRSIFDLKALCLERTMIGVNGTTLSQPTELVPGVHRSSGSFEFRMSQVEHRCPIKINSFDCVYLSVVCICVSIMRISTLSGLLGEVTNRFQLKQYLTILSLSQCTLSWWANIDRRRISSRWGPLKP